MILNQEWQALLATALNQEYFKELQDYVAKRRETGVLVFPPSDEIFNAFAWTSPQKLKVVILGQDPYHGQGQAHGLSFSVPTGIKIPPSLGNIYKELMADVPGFTQPRHGDLSHWAKQGVLLLNTVLTVEEGQAHSHKNIGWEKFTQHVLAQISSHCHDVVFLLWGKPAQQAMQSIDTKQHHVLTSTHPSPLSAYRGFLGCRHFSQTNKILSRVGKQIIDWQVP